MQTTTGSLTVQNSYVNMTSRVVSPQSMETNKQQFIQKKMSHTCSFATKSLNFRMVCWWSKIVSWAASNLFSIWKKQKLWIAYLYSISTLNFYNVQYTPIAVLIKACNAMICLTQLTVQNQKVCLLREINCHHSLDILSLTTTDHKQTATSFKLNWKQHLL